MDADRTQQQAQVPEDYEAPRAEDIDSSDGPVAVAALNTNTPPQDGVAR
jgi:hypothetical protein